MKNTHFNWREEKFFEGIVKQELVEETIAILQKRGLVTKTVNVEGDGNFKLIVGDRSKEALKAIESGR